jgi:hypothetical protein
MSRPSIEPKSKESKKLAEADGKLSKPRVWEIHADIGEPKCERNCSGANEKVTRVCKVLGMGQWVQMKRYNCLAPKSAGYMPSEDSHGEKLLSMSRQQAGTGKQYQETAETHQGA